MATTLDPFFPIIYVRGYAMTSGEIAETVSTPYMGFNLGSTKARQAWDGKVERHVFESPLIRLMKDYGYRDVYSGGSEVSGRLPARSIVIYRYYESADKDLGSGKVLSITEAAKGLGDLIRKIAQQVCDDDAALLKQFKVYLVAHSMGGLVCRCFLQNEQVGNEAERRMVAKVFTYATPHNGIEIAGINVPSVLGLWDMNNFNRGEMAKYLGLKGTPERVDTLDGKFDPNRFFCLVGTNHRDYDVAGGWSARLAGEMSDGLVKIENAAVQGAPRAFAFRSHSGPYGVVNSEEGYQNLVRFLFGDVRVDGELELEALPLPPSVQKDKDAGKTVRASYYFESTVAPRGAFTFKLTERRRDTYSAVLRKFDELMRPGKTKQRPPVLFSAFLDTSRITSGQSLVFSIELAVSTTGYTVDGFLFLKHHVEGEYLFRDTIAVRATPRKDGWSVRYAMTDARWSEGAGSAAGSDAQGWFIPLSSGKGFKGKLRLRIRT